MNIFTQRRYEELYQAADRAARASVPPLEIIPAGTPDRKCLQREADARYMLSLRGLVDYAALRAQAIREARQKAAVARACDPVNTLRREVFAALRKLGFKRETTSGASAYYFHKHAGVTVRVSDHEVPLTAEREYNLTNGGRSWANSRFSHVLSDSAAAQEWLADVADELTTRMELA